MAVVKILTTAALSIAALAVAAGPASADNPEPFTITEHVNLNGGENTFTATGPLCSSGVFEDTVRVVAADKGSSDRQVLLINSVYVCDDGTGTFSALKHVVITFGTDGTFTNTGPITLQGGTGDYVGLTGHGVDVGSAAGGTGVGNITGVVVR